jgi:acetoin utilization deacetylase AcuC-like enzyme
MTLPATPVVTAPRHAGHSPAVEVQCGRALPAFDTTRRMASILDRLSAEDGVTLKEPASFGAQPIEQVHDPELLRFLAQAWDEAQPPGDGIEAIFADTFLHAKLRAAFGPLPEAGRLAGDFGRFCFDTITAIGPLTWAAATASVDTALTAASELLADRDLAVALCRPPGHHVTRDLFGGGCYLNNAAITAQWLRDQGMSRVVILDLDFHHGNGSQALFYDRADVLYASLHGNPEHWYPFFTGWPDETGTGAGRGYNQNVLMPAQVDGDGYIALLSRMLERISSYRCDAVVVSLGFDTAEGDISGDATLRGADYRRVGAHVASLGLPAVAVLEGGYVVETLGANLAEWIRGFRDERVARD